LRRDDPRLDTLVLTSEDPAFLREVESLLRARRRAARSNGTGTRGTRDVKGRLGAQGTQGGRGGRGGGGPVWRVVRNPDDVMPGSGSPDVVLPGSTGRYNHNGHSVDEVFMSFMSSMLLLMRARYFVLNCQSNFHLMLK
jgi:hypothetical protein